MVNYRSLYDIVDVKGHLLSKYDLEKSGLPCSFIEYNALKIKTAKTYGNILSKCAEKWSESMLEEISRKKKRISILHMSDIYNSDYCIEEFLQMNIC